MKLKTTFTAPILTLVVLILLGVSRRLELEKLLYHDNISLAVIVLELMILVVPAGFYIRLRGDGFSEKLKFSFIGPQKLLATILASVTILLGTMLLKLLFYSIGLIEGEYLVWQYYMNGAETNLVYRLLTFCLIPSIAEELLFRGVLCADYEQHGALTAVVASSALYALFGLDLGYFPIFFFAGLGYALVLFMTRSVFAAMLCHFTVSVIDTIIGETMWNIIRKPQSTTFLIFALAGLFLLCLFSMFSECERVYYGYAMSNTSSEHIGAQTVGSFLSAIFAPPFIADVLVFFVAAMQYI